MDTTMIPNVGPIQEKVGNTGATRFSMRRMPQLSEGTTFDAVATAENLWLSIKVYASGGENAFHHHTVEDHAFVVLQGKATFYFMDGNEFVAEQYEGVMLPKGAYYRFQADEAENLVMLRIGAAQRKTQGIEKLQKHGSPVELLGTTFDDDGTVKVSRHGKSKKPNSPPVKIPGLFFPKD